jgi:hypothetical protein
LVVAEAVVAVVRVVLAVVGAVEMVILGLEDKQAP